MPQINRTHRRESFKGWLLQIARWKIAGQFRKRAGQARRAANASFAGSLLRRAGRSAQLLPAGLLAGCGQRLEKILPVHVIEEAKSCLACSARALASFASYADQLLSHTEIVNCGPERHSDLGKAETS
jgi:hypothetical protein